ncbi:hypothetical protein ACQCX2_09105 [Propionibacteriaceae bacterium Y1700]|uniref:hypothetical protein n=1 Tax=Microlunatus sp. Y1700 TaxID=3418487 RepID=UPI003DA78968
MIDPHEMARSRQWWNELSCIPYLLQDPSQQATDSLLATMHGRAVLQICPATSAFIERGDEAVERVLWEWWETDNDQYAGQLKAGLIDSVMMAQPVGNVLARIARHTTNESVRNTVEQLAEHHKFTPTPGLPDHFHPRPYPRTLDEIVRNSLQFNLLREINRHHDAEKTQILINALCHLPYGADLLEEDRRRQRLAPARRESAWP